MTGSSETVVWSADYKPFGEATVTISTITNNLRFPGQYYDAETGTLYNYFRDYDPAIGRYKQADPIGLLGGINIFAYVKNNPVNFVDPLGLRQYTDPDRGNWGPLTNALAHLWNNYWEMRRARTMGADKFFHCMAHCQSAKEGPIGVGISELWGETWELTDEYIINPLKKMDKDTNRKDCNDDRAANRQGREGDKTKRCKETCESYRPVRWNPNYDGWQQYE